MLEESPVTTDMAAYVHHNGMPESITYLQQRMKEQGQILQRLRHLYSLNFVIAYVEP